MKWKDYQGEISVLTKIQQITEEQGFQTNYFLTHHPQLLPGPWQQGQLRNLQNTVLKKKTTKKNKALCSKSGQNLPLKVLKYKFFFPFFCSFFFNLSRCFLIKPCSKQRKIKSILLMQIFLFIFTLYNVCLKQKYQNIELPCEITERTHLVFSWLVSGRCLQLGRKDKSKPDSGLLEGRGSLQAQRRPVGMPAPMNTLGVYVDSPGTWRIPCDSGKLSPFLPDSCWSRPPSRDQIYKLGPCQDRKKSKASPPPTDLLPQPSTDDTL